ncbi:lysosomal acid phosphatase-like [Adelges cooleyi]|uniref:lysosomal acid phosphatase-like n=1 Tax=Adelges cooleyi TaxID=133065 RepID=UPI00217F67EE|nr:lysosomal acid phosphatase-like [Adelges cooleyi]
MSYTCSKKALIFGILVAFVVAGIYMYYTIVVTKTDSSRPYQNISVVHPALKFAVVIFRHGDRAPLYSYKTDPYTNAFPEGKSQLTKLGKRHMFTKGQILRRLYDGFLSKVYLPKEIYTKTTAVARTHMSAGLVLAGLYPPTGYQKWLDSETVWQPIPIYGGSPDHSDGIFNNCPSGSSSFKTAIVKSTQLDNETHEELLSYLSNKCGQPIQLYDIYSLYDLLNCQINAGLQPPDWTNPNYYEQIAVIAERKESRQFLCGNKKLQNLFIGPLIKEIASEIQEKSHNSTSELQKMIMYSGHDLTIQFIATILGNEMTQPHYGASLHFHLYRYNETEGDIVKVLFYKSWNDNEGNTLPISDCGDPCKVDDFVKLFNGAFTKTWEEECQEEE